MTDPAFWRGKKVFLTGHTGFKGAWLASWLEQLGAERLVMAGTATEMCVAQSAIDARELGYKVTVLTDACASVDREMAGTALAYLERVVGVRLEAGALSTHSR